MFSDKNQGKIGRTLHDISNVKGRGEAVLTRKWMKYDRTRNVYFVHQSGRVRDSSVL